MAKGRKTKTAESDARGQAALPFRGAGSGSDFLRRYLARSLEVFLYWMPVWVPLILLAQLGTRGLRPALAEERRLLRHEAELDDRLEADEAEALQLEDTLEALDDPIFLERLRRQRRERLREEARRRGLEPTVPEEEGPEDESTGATGD